MSTRHPVYFIGIALPPELERQVFSFKWKLYDEAAHALKPLVPHITLLHPPSLRGVLPSELLPEIRNIAAPYLPLTLSFETLGAFGSSVLYIRVNSPELKALQSELVKLLPPEAQDVYHQRRYAPHITLAQVRKPHMLDIEALRRRTCQELALPLQFTVNSVSCFMRIHQREYTAENI